MASVLCPVPTPHIPLVWPDIREMVAKAVARGGRSTADDVFASLCRGDSQLWLIWNDGPEALVVTEIHQFPLLKLMRLTIVTGHDRQNWLPFLEQIEAWAKSQGCEVVEPVARLGWERVLKPLGYRASHVVLEKRL